MKKSTKNKSNLPAIQSQRTRDFIKRTKGTSSIDLLLKEYADKMDTGEMIKDIEVGYKLTRKVHFALGLDSHEPVIDAVASEYRHFIHEFISRTEEEYNCTTSIEKSLAQNIALAHVRIIQLSKAMTSHTTGKTNINDDINDHYSMISKELDRAHRHLTNAILTLKQIKAPTTSFNINAKTAFIANNQEIQTL